MSYKVKEAGYRIYASKTRDEAENRFAEWRASVTQAMKGAFGDFKRAWGNWETEILNYFDHRLTNAYTESLNNLIRSTNRIGRGYSFEALRARGTAGRRTRENIEGAATVTEATTPRL